MIDRKPHRVVRELTAAEREILRAARDDVEAEKECILEQALAVKAALLETRQSVDTRTSRLGESGHID